MAADALFLTARADLIQAWRRMVDQGPMRLAATLVAGLALIAAEVWIVDRLARQVLALPPIFLSLAETALGHLATLISELTMMVAAASAVVHPTWLRCWTRRTRAPRPTW